MFSPKSMSNLGRLTVRTCSFRDMCVSGTRRIYSNSINNIIFLVSLCRLLSNTAWANVCLCKEFVFILQVKWRQQKDLHSLLQM